MTFRATIAAAWGLGLAWAAAAQEGALALRSPFDPLMAGAGPASPADGLELRGIMATAESTRFCIFDPARNTGTWAAANEAGNPFVVTSGDSARDSVTLVAGGRTLTLSLRDARVRPAPPEAPVPAGAPSQSTLTRRMPGEPRAPRRAPGP